MWNTKPYSETSQGRVCILGTNPKKSRGLFLILVKWTGSSHICIRISKRNITWHYDCNSGKDHAYFLHFETTKQLNWVIMLKINQLRFDWNLWWHSIAWYVRQYFHQLINIDKILHPSSYAYLIKSCAHKSINGA